MPVYLLTHENNIDTQSVPNPTIIALAIFETQKKLKYFAIHILLPTRFPDQCTLSMKEI